MEADMGIPGLREDCGMHVLPYDPGLMIDYVLLVPPARLIATRALGGAKRRLAAKYDLRGSLLRTWAVMHIGVNREASFANVNCSLS